jgi:hypothetical protein
MVKAIEKEGENSYVPGWPWAWLQWCLRIAPKSILKKMS